MGKRAHARISDTSVRVYGGRAASLGFRASVCVRAAAGESTGKEGTVVGTHGGCLIYRSPLAASTEEQSQEGR